MNSSYGGRITYIFIESTKEDNSFKEILRCLQNDDASLCTYVNSYDFENLQSETTLPMRPEAVPKKSTPATA